MNETDDIEIPEATNEISKSIKAIDKGTVHKICSGQVVLSLAVAIKELVENSIDAGATLVEVKLRDHGLESLEVSDNGSGVEEQNFKGMTAKYHTSKIREFTDLQGVETFGFRGEALSSLCALSTMVIITRHRSADVGTKLELDHEGNIVNKSLCARQIGTSVILTNLFSTLPVRRKEFTKSIKKEFNKMCQILQAYCLVSKGVRIICTNTTPNGTKTTFMCTHGSQSVRENIQAIFGSKQVSDLMEIKPPINPGENFTKELLTDLQDPNSSLEISPEDIDKLNLATFRIEGWISSCSHGSGRSSKDRQYYFINSRPCEPKNIIKLVNEVYHRYNVQQYPFVFLNIICERSEVDVNITPDKRQLLVNNEKILLLTVKRSLLNTFSSVPSTFKVQKFHSDSVIEQESNILDVDSDDDIKLEPNPKKFKEVLSQWKATGRTDEPAKPLRNIKRKAIDEITARNFKLKKIQEYLTQGSTNDSVKVEENFAKYKSDSESDDSEEKDSCNTSVVQPSEIATNSKEFDILTHKSTTSKPTIDGSQKEDCIVQETVINCKVISNTNTQKIFEDIDKLLEKETSSDLESEGRESEIIFDTSDDEKVPLECTDGEICITVDEIRQLTEQEEHCRNKAKGRAELDRLKFKSKINPSENKNAEEELQREITKDMFAKMEIIGQFNCGFIITKLDSDLFIVDQHATDEKYNFEDLQKRTVLQSQPLAIPQTLELTAVNEMILIDNLKVFEANGFKFQIDENAPVTRKVKLLAKPFSKNWEFGKDDIDELIFMLQDAPPDTMCRPSRVRAMFASRACRKSIMIGSVLNKSLMKRLITHMGEIEQPWNCPHGRPTMRHLVNIAMLKQRE